MFSNIIYKMHNFLLSHVMEWCGSYRFIVLTVWLCLIAMLCALFLLILKTVGLFSYKENTDILMVICKTIEENDIVKCINLLEQYPSYINRYTRDGYTPFLIACANGKTQLVRVMLRKGADIKQKSLKKESAFYLATFYYIKYPQVKNATCLRELYYAGADINDCNEKCLTPLQMAAMFGHTALVKWLLIKNASTKTIPDPYIIAMTQGHQDTAALIWTFTTNFSLTYK